jgi:tRNA A37 threonylcarbamoyltransferase TsaD
MEEVTEFVSLPDEVAANLCASFQDVAFTHVEDRIKRAMEYIDGSDLNVSSLVVVGGVAANEELRKYIISCTFSCACIR